MTLESLIAAKEVLVSIAALAAAYFSLAMRSEVLKLKLEIAEARAADIIARSREKDEMRDWINGSFMRSREVLDRLGSIEDRLSKVEENQE